MITLSFNKNNSHHRLFEMKRTQNTCIMIELKTTGQTINLLSIQDSNQVKSNFRLVHFIQSKLENNNKTNTK